MLFGNHASATTHFSQPTVHLLLGVKVRNLKVEFKTGGTWRLVGQQTLIMKIYDYFYST